MHWGIFITFLTASCAGAATGMLFRPGIWYETLNKPSWTPRKWMFPTVWTILYVSSSYAAARIAVLPENGLALAFWAMQIAFNTLWTPIFFGLHRMQAALIAIAALWIAVAGMAVTFWPLDVWAGLFATLYLIWVTVAAALNLWIVRNNRGVRPSEA